MDEVGPMSWPELHGAAWFESLECSPLTSPPVAAYVMSRVERYERMTHDTRNFSFIYWNHTSSRALTGRHRCRDTPRELSPKISTCQAPRRPSCRSPAKKLEVDEYSALHSALSRHKMSRGARSAVSESAELINSRSFIQARSARSFTRV